ncbi:MAG: cupin protein, partial [Chloroflexi bacterium]|nr:cupin protein [Chloroflexota bacterium]
QQPRDKTVGFSQQVFGGARPSWLKSPHRTPPFRYPWKDTNATLQALRASDTPPDPHDGYHLTYAHPVDGGPTLPTMACEIQLHPVGVPSRSHRHNSTTIYHVFRGEGATVIDSEAIEWSRGDIFVIPPWATHRHENRASEDAILFSICDWPAIRALGLYEEEAGGD